MKKTSRFVKTWIGLALLVSLAVVRGDELQSLPPAMPAPAPEITPLSRQPSPSMPTAAPAEVSRAAPSLGNAIDVNALAVTRIASGVPAYTERGVVMVPLRLLAQFLRLRVRNVQGVTMIEQTTAAPTIRLMFRNGSVKAQVEQNGVTRAVSLPVPAQTRLGNTFVPAREVSAVFGATAQAVPEEKAILLHFEGRSGLFSSIAPNGYRGDNAARVVIENNVGKALSLHLSGPQNVLIELGSRGRVTRNLRPGVYNFQAASNGMKIRRGVRRFGAKQRAVWNWGRK